MEALSGFLDWCQQSGCSLAVSGNPRDVLTQLIACVDQQPMDASYVINGVTREGIARRPSLLENAVLSLLYDRSRGWPLLADALSQAVNTGPRASLLAYADQYVGRTPDGHWDPQGRGQHGDRCVDRPTKWHRRRRAELADVATFQSQLPPWGGSLATASCVGMPKPAKGDKLGDVQVRGTAPILVIGTTGDPATPYVGARGARGAHPGLRPAHLREHRAHRVRPRHQHLHRRRRRPPTSSTARCPHPAPAAHP